MSEQLTYEEATRQFQREFLLKALKEERGITTRAARRVKVHRNMYSRLLRELGFDSYEVKQYLGVSQRGGRRRSRARLEGR